MIIATLVFPLFFCSCSNEENLGFEEEQTVVCRKSETTASAPSVQRIADSTFNFATRLMEEFIGAAHLKNFSIKKHVELLNSHRANSFLDEEERELLRSESFWEFIAKNQETKIIVHKYLHDESKKFGSLNKLFTQNLFYDQRLRQVLVYLLFAYEKAVAEDLAAMNKLHQQQNSLNANTWEGFMASISWPYFEDIVGREHEQIKVLKLIARLLGVSKLVPEVKSTAYARFYQSALAENHQLPILALEQEKEVLKEIFELSSEVSLLGLFRGHFLSEDQLHGLVSFLDEAKALAILKKMQWSEEERDYIAQEIVRQRRSFMSVEAKNYALGALANLYAPVYAEDCPFGKDFESLQEVVF